MYQPPRIFRFRDHPLHEVTDFGGCSHNKWRTASRCNTDKVRCAVCDALHSRNLKNYTTAIKHSFVTCGFSNYHVSSNDDSVVQLKIKRMIGRVSKVGTKFRQVVVAQSV
jgi:hypothetical protein